MNEKQKEVAKNIIIALGAVGFISAVMVAPGLIKAWPLLKKIDIARINQEIKRLYKRGLVEMIKKKNGLTTIKLTQIGREKLRRYQIDQLKIEKPKTWDKRWRIVIFDIPTKKNLSRDLLRRKMKNLGFYKLQNSVFVHPFPCYEIVEFIKDYYGVRSEVEYLEADKLESQNDLINYFFT